MQHHQIQTRGDPPEVMSGPTTSAQNNDARWNLIHSLEFQPSSATDLRTSTSSSNNKLEVHNDDASNNKEDDNDQDEVMSFDSNRSQQSTVSSVIGANDSCPFARSNNYLDELVDCFRNDVEESFRRQQQALGSRQTDRDEAHSRSPTSNSSSCSTPSSTCELVSTLQNHFKSAAVAMATAAAAAAAAAAASASAPASATVPVSSNQINPRRATAPEPNGLSRGSNFTGCTNSVVCGSSANYSCNLNYSKHHELTPLDLKMLPGHEIWPSDHEVRGLVKLDEEDADEDELDLISIDNDVQHTEIVQTTMANPEESSLLLEGRLNSKMSLNEAILASNPVPHPPRSPPKSKMIEPEQPPSGNQTKTNGSPRQLQQQSTSPANNPHGHHQHSKNRRLYKCRHCPFETDKKVENWQHIRVHMRPEKLLSCNSCLFVTEYKHHLEYHQRNHTGYKPFKCEHCDYTCVNKSMLNSHMKSHSSVYQYQCGDCKYATKYVHSLKMHLRKYNHRPAAMMIDIFGRKRGPKPGSGKKQQQQQHSTHSVTIEPVSTSTSNGKSKSRSKQQQINHQNCNILDLRVNSKIKNQ